MYNILYENCENLQTSVCIGNIGTYSIYTVYVNTVYISGYYSAVYVISYQIKSKKICQLDKGKIKTGITPDISVPLTSEMMATTLVIHFI